MNKTYIVIVVLVLVAGGLFFMTKSTKLEAPIVDNIPGKACTQEAMICPDGSAVGRSGPNCEFAACPRAESVQAVKEFTISGQNFSFTPSSITVKKGDRVKITFNNTSGFHDFKIDEYGVATKQTKSPTTEVLEFTADKTGNFEYYCSVGTHRVMGMKGTLKVE